MQRGRDNRTLVRFLSKVDKANDCWLWTAALLKTGYGRFKKDGKTKLAHRVSYELLVGPIPDGLTLDHLCRERRCVNPAHLEPVTAKVNVLRGETITAHNARKEQCIRGHLLRGDNLFVRRDGHRLCRHCKRAGESKRRDSDDYRQQHARYEHECRARKERNSDSVQTG